MIVTFWPSSRRLAIRPPHERATSSGWGATKTWVMAGRVYRPGPRLAAVPRSAAEALGTDERHEDAGPFRSLDPLVAVPRHHGEDLAIARPDRDHEPSAVGELVAERVRDRWRGGGHDDPVPRGTVRRRRGCRRRPGPRRRRRTRGRRAGRRAVVRQVFVALDRRDAAAERSPGRPPGSRTRCRSPGCGRPAASPAARS